MTLTAYLTSHLNTAFEWGQADCVIFAAGWVKHATGINYLADVPPWGNEREARRLIARLGGIEAILDARLKRVPVNAATDGDIGLYQNALCIFSGPHIVGLGMDGLQHIKRTDAQCAWSF